MNNRIVILTYGTFDLIHYGHIKLLKRAKAMGGKLYVGLSTDSFNFIKGKKSFQDYNERFETLSELKCIDYIFPENDWDQKKSDIKKYNASILTMGDDWLGKFDFLSDICEVVYLPRTPGVSTTLIKSALNEN